MTEYLETLTSTKIETLHLAEVEPRLDTPIHLGAKTVKFAQIEGNIEMQNTGARASTPEGERNAELYKQAYDAAIEAIQSAFEADSSELDGRLGAVLSSIDALSTVPYISSAPEFVGFVKSARNSVEQAQLSLTSSEGDTETSTTVANALSQAAQDLNATTVAYRP